MDSRHTPHALMAVIIVWLMGLVMMLLTSCEQLLPFVGSDSDTSPPSTPGTEAGAPTSPTVEAPAEVGSDTLDRFTEMMSERPLSVALGLLVAVAVVLLVILIRQERRATSQTLSTAPRDTARLEPRGEKAPSPVLVLNTGAGETVQPLTRQGLTIGRAADNDLVIDASVEGSETVSDHHARVYFDMGHWIVRDLGSQNGIYVNDQRTGHNLLEDGWHLRVGRVTMTFREGSGEAGS
ncbi:MAG: FHA domain-containing protein [Anaerolineae bacterium]